jgi:hypothetical protein
VGVEGAAVTGAAVEIVVSCGVNGGGGAGVAIGAELNVEGGRRSCSIPLRIRLPPNRTPPRSIRKPKVTDAYGELAIVTAPLNTPPILKIKPTTPPPKRNSPITASGLRNGFFGGGGASFKPRYLASQGKRTFDEPSISP